MTENEAGLKFRHSVGFGKRMEFWIIGEMLRLGLDVYIPLVDDRGVDAVVRRPDGSFVELQIKARFKKVKLGDAALFGAIQHLEAILIEYDKLNCKLELHIWICQNKTLGIIITAVVHNHFKYRVFFFFDIR